MKSKGVHVEESSFDIHLRFAGVSNMPNSRVMTQLSGGIPLSGSAKLEAK